MRHNRSRSPRSRRSRHRSCDLENSDDSEYERERESKKKKMITEDDIAEYLAKKAQKKALKVAKKLKSQTVFEYANDSNPIGDSNLNETLLYQVQLWDWKGSSQFTITMEDHAIDAYFQLHHLQQHVKDVQIVEFLE